MGVQREGAACLCLHLQPVEDSEEDCEFAQHVFQHGEGERLRESFSVTRDVSTKDY